MDIEEEPIASTSKAALARIAKDAAASSESWIPGESRRSEKSSESQDDSVELQKAYDNTLSILQKIITRRNEEVQLLLKLEDLSKKLHESNQLKDVTIQVQQAQINSLLIVKKKYSTLQKKMAEAMEDDGRPEQAEEHPSDPADQPRDTGIEAPHPSPVTNAIDSESTSTN